MLAHREDVQYRLLVEFTHLLGPDAVIDGEAIRKIVTRLLADYLTHARKLVHRPSRAEFDSASTALAAEERPEHALQLEPRPVALTQALRLLMGPCANPEKLYCDQTL